MPPPTCPRPTKHDPRLTAAIVALCALFSTVLLVLSQACTGAQQQQARQVFQLAEGGCAVLEGVTNDPRVANLCLSRDELAIALDAVLKARAAASAAVAGAPAPSASAPARAP